MGSFQIDAVQDDFNTDRARPSGEEKSLVGSGAEGEGEPAPQPVPRARSRASAAGARTGWIWTKHEPVGYPERLLLDSVEVAALLLGHSDIAMTMNTYSHVIPELRRDAADRMDDLITGGRER